MKRVLTFMISAMLLLLAVMPASAQTDSANASTPDASATAVASPNASPMASPIATDLEAGEWTYVDEDGNDLTIQLTALTGEIDGAQVVDEFDPEDGISDTDLSFSQELDGPDDCRIFEYETPDVPYFVALCASDEFGLWAFGSDVDAVTHVAEQFVDGNADLVPEGYTEDD